jgi:hypothetical protein
VTAADHVIHIDFTQPDSKELQPTAVRFVRVLTSRSPSWVAWKHIIISGMIDEAPVPTIRQGRWVGFNAPGDVNSELARRALPFDLQQKLWNGWRLQKVTLIERLRCVAGFKVTYVAPTVPDSATSPPPADQFVEYSFGRSPDSAKNKQGLSELVLKSEQCIVSVTGRQGRVLDQLVLGVMSDGKTVDFAAGNATGGLGFPNLLPPSTLFCVLRVVDAVLLFSSLIA